ncbi:hypothetical protein XCV3944 [Xanthomonas euvesicatoria pv. vesicatoria str. 85-10]|uniref:GST C-terminal domain-containing protein n=1 Tax=Xanthomonas euvesicatoria pv. vesicatoria (strain 85-10) TaxID=316273 RepID=Q3BNI8_XANE5|nr:hypothetical protein XCV3944 [Xanthomonas euvesicatoria pv. vesicatoria str. 85-10]
MRRRSRRGLYLDRSRRRIRRQRHAGVSRAEPEWCGADLAGWCAGAVGIQCDRALPGRPVRACVVSTLAARARAGRSLDGLDHIDVCRSISRSVLGRAAHTGARARSCIAAALAQSGELLARADAALAQQPYLSGEQFAMGDIPLGSFIYAWFEMPIERPELPHLRAWYERLRARPAYQRAVMTALT